MSDTCSNCKYWTHWRTVACTDDEPKAIGHCVAEEVAFRAMAIQGLTGEDFWCPHYVPESPPSKLPSWRSDSEPRSDKAER